MWHRDTRGGSRNPQIVISIRLMLLKRQLDVASSNTILFSILLYWIKTIGSIGKNDSNRKIDLPYFIDQSPRRLIISFCRYLRRLFKDGDYSRAASIKEYCLTITFITSYEFVPSFIVILFLIIVSIYVLFICLDPLFASGYVSTFRTCVQVYLEWLPCLC